MVLEIKHLGNMVRNYACNCYQWVAWKLCRELRKEKGINEDYREKAVIVTLTSFPERILLVEKAIKSVLNQRKVKPDKVELWLADSQFPEKEKELPNSLLYLQEKGLDICWCKDIKSYKKLIPALRHHPDVVLVTVDDDAIYGRNWLKALYEEYQKNPNVIQCHKATKFYLSEDEYRAKSGGYKYYKAPSFLNKLVGVGGVLYPPYCLHQKVLDECLFMTITPTNDDIWFWLMAVMNNIKINVVKRNKPKPAAIIGVELTHKLEDINDNGEELFWIQFAEMMVRFPELDEKLRAEYKEMEKIMRV